MVEAKDILEKYFGYSEFRGGQEAIIHAILDGRDVLVIMPTGGGKSLCYQIPAMMSDGLTLVVSPLISLMKDQVDALKRIGVAARQMNSHMTTKEHMEALAMAREGKLKLLYIAPEKLESDFFCEQLRALPIKLVAVDEAHCVSQWGHDFRPSYRQIARRLLNLNKRPVFAAFTATATEHVREDIICQLHLQEPYVYVSSFNRPNIFFSVQQPHDKRRTLLETIEAKGSTIVYCATRRMVEEVSDYLADHGIPAGRYHAGMSDEERIRNQEDFVHGQTAVIVATNAFGMGINKANVRQVIHYNMPKNIESYYQEVGRAGRDGKPSEAILFYAAQDIMTNLFLINQSQEPYIKEKLDAMIAYAYTGSCLRKYLLNYFGEKTEWEACGACAICQSYVETEDITEEAQKVLSCIVRMGQNYGVNMVIDVLRGSKGQRIRELRFDRLSTFGIMKSQTTQDIREIITLLASEQYLRVSGENYPILKLTAKSVSLLRGEDGIRIKRTIRKPSPVKADKSKVFDAQLFQKLIMVREKLAINLNIEKFRVFSNKVLEDMAIHMPTNEQELLSLKGIGEKKSNQFGGPFLSVIRGHLKDSRSENKRSTYDQTLDLYQLGLAPQEIAEKRSLTLGTIYSHLIKLVSDGKIVDISKMVSENERKSIEILLREKPHIGLKEIYIFFDGQITYEAIQLILADIKIRHRI